jgi:hypothetical protein
MCDWNKMHRQLEVSKHGAPHLLCYRPVRIHMYSSQAGAAHLRHPVITYNTRGYSYLLSSYPVMGYNWSDGRRSQIRFCSVNLIVSAASFNYFAGINFVSCLETYLQLLRKKQVSEARDSEKLKSGF